MHPTLQYILDRHLDGAHSVFSPSASKMWLTCLGSLIPNILSSDSSGEEAAYGTVAHELTEMWLKTGQRPDHILGKLKIVEDDHDFHVIHVDTTMLDYVEESVSRCQLLPGKHIVETRVDFSELTPIPNQAGTLDHAAEDGEWVTITDHKYGKIEVSAHRNPQAMIYAFAYIKDKPHIRYVRIRINQPRLNNFDEWETTRDEIMQFAGYVRERAALAWNVDAPRTPDPEACRWCRVQSTCPAYAQMQFRLAEGMTAIAFGAEQMQTFKASVIDGTLVVPTPDPHALTTVHLARLYPFRRQVEKWWTQTSVELMRRAQAGEDIPDLKIVEGRGRREFVGDAADLLIEHGLTEDQVITKKIISPSAAEPLLIKAGHRRKDLKELLSDVVEKRPGKPTLVPLADRRPALVDLTGIVFGDVSEESSDEPEEL